MIDSFDSLRILYFRYKETPYYSISVFLLCLLVGVILILQVIMPQLQNWFSITTEVEATRGRIKVLEDNIRILSALDDASLDRDISTTTDTLPFDKNFTGIVDALSASASEASVSISDYGFSIGELSTPSAQLNQFYKVPVHITVYGDLPSAKAFIQKLNAKIPLSEVEAWDGGSGGSNLSIIFYYKGFPSILLNDLSVLQPLTPEQNQFLETLNTWRPSGSYTNEVTPASESGEPSFSFPL